MTTVEQNRAAQVAPAPRSDANLTDRWAIFDLVARYDDAVNRRDVPEFRSLWTDDAVWEIGDPKPRRVEGAEEIIATWQMMLGKLAWLFRGTFAGVATIDGDRATGRWPCIKTGTFAKEKDGDEIGYDNRAVFEDIYVRNDGRWYFQTRRSLYLWLSNEKLPGSAVKLGEELLA